MKSVEELMKIYALLPYLPRILSINKHSGKQIYFFISIDKLNDKFHSIAELASACRQVDEELLKVDFAITVNLSKKSIRFYPKNSQEYCDVPLRSFKRKTNWIYERALG